MKWNWQADEWPIFTYNPSNIEELESNFLLSGAYLSGVTTTLDRNNQLELAIEFIEEEALKSSKIEGEILDGPSIRASLRSDFGLDVQAKNIPPREKGIASMMVDAYHSFNQPLTHEMMFTWHKSLMLGNRRIDDIGCYRTHEDDMTVGSHNFNDTTAYFVAPPSVLVPEEMGAFVDWFNRTSPDGSEPLPAVTRAGLAHLYFVSIHPFEDGNGRIGRALCEKVFSQHLARPALVSLSHVIEKYKKKYYSQLANSNQKMNVDGWLSYFAKTSLDAVGHSRKLTLFILEKRRLYDRIRERINERQSRVLDCMLKKGVEGWQGGMTARKYMKISGSVIATTTRDLKQLVDLGAFTKTGQLKGTRYWLNLGKEFEGEKNKHLADLKERKRG